jgi:hypothetical protein
MTSKLHNRTLFVAALSVYFGLLIVGAPPQVLAQTSKTIRDSERIVVQKDFQTLNYVNRKGGASGRTLAEAFEQFFEDVKNDATAKSLLSNADFELRSIAARDFFDENSPPPILLSVNSRNLQKLNEALITCIARNSFHFNLAEDAGELILISVNEVDFSITQNEIVLKTSTIWGAENQHKVAGFANSLQDLYHRRAVSDSAIKRLIYSNTEVFVNNNQVFVVTRLPRAGLDSLLKADEKAN